MAGYEKFTLKSFQEKLASGGYDSLKGANRAIGRMSTWSEKERDKAREMASNQLGGLDPVKAAKPKKGAATKASGPPLRRKKKTGKKVEKKVSATKGKAKGRAAVPEAPKGKTKAVKPQTRKSATGPIAQAASSVRDPIEQYDRIGDSIHRRLESLDLARRLGAPSTDVADSARQAQRALTQVIDALGSSVSNLIGGLSEEERRGAAAFEKAALATNAIGGNGIKSSPVSAAPPMPQSYAQPDGQD